MIQDGEPRSFAMPIPLRSDFDAARLRQAARSSQNASQVRRLLALAAIYDGATRTCAATIGGVTLQVIRDWVLKFNARGPDGLIDRRAPGQPSRLNAAYRAALAAVIEAGPDPAAHGVVRWRILDLRQWLQQEFQVSVSKQTLSRELRAMGFRKLSARPKHHAQAEGAIDDFKKNSPRRWIRSRASRASGAATSKFGSPMRRASDRRTNEPAAGPGAAAGPPPRATSAPPPPIFSAQSVPPPARPPASSCLAATPRR
jgi:transposase